MEFFNDVGSDPSRPSIFELVAQEQLRDLLQPALKYVLSVCFTFTQNSSDRLTHIRITRYSPKGTQDTYSGLSTDMKSSMHC